MKYMMAISALLFATTAMAQWDVSSHNVHEGGYVASNTSTTSMDDDTYNLMVYCAEGFPYIELENLENEIPYKDLYEVGFFFDNKEPIYLFGEHWESVVIPDTLPALIDLLETSNTLIIGWSNGDTQMPTVVKFSMKGSSKAISTAMQSCSVAFH